MGVVEVLEDEHEADEDDRGHCLGESLHDGSGAGGVEDISEETRQSLNTKLNEENMETQESGLDQLDRGHIHVSDHASIRDNTKSDEDDDCEDEAEKVEEPHADLLDHEGHHEENQKTNRVNDQREKVVKILIHLTRFIIIMSDYCLVESIITVMNSRVITSNTISIKNLNDKLSNVQ